MISAFRRQWAEGGGRLILERLLPSAFCFVLTALAAAPLFANSGFLSTRGIGDSPNLLFRVHQLLAALVAGEWPARWMPDAAYGYGLPYFTYYASASTHVAALLKAYGFSYVTALKLTQALALLVGAWAMSGWLRAAGLAGWPAALGAAAYTFAPFHLVNLYIRGDSLAELWAQALFPLALWAAQRLLAEATAGRLFGLAAAVAGLICTHNISALNFLPVLTLYLGLGALAAAPALRRPLLGVSAAGLLWGLALAAFFWLPALGEGGLVQLGGLTQGYFAYANHFRGVDLFQTGFVFDYTAQPFSLGLIQTALAGAGLLGLLVRAGRERRWPWLNTFVLLGLAVSTLLITPLSRPLWERVPLLAFTQFPWRFLSPLALFTAAATAALVPQPGPRAPQPRPGRPGMAPAALTLAPTLLLAFSALAGLRLTFIPLTDADVTAERLNLYEYFTTAIGNTVNAEYLPAAVAPRPFTSDQLLGRAPELKVLSGAATGERLWKRGAAEQWRITAAGPGPARVAVPTYFWPGWAGVVDDRPAEVQAVPGLGWLSLEVPPGEHTVTFRLGRTPLRLGAELLSLASALPLAVFALRRRRPPARWVRRARAVPVLPWALGLGAAGFVLLRLLPAAPAPSAPLNLDFDTLAYPHEAPVRFDDGTQLLTLTASAARLRPGQTLTLRAVWLPAGSGTAVFSLVNPWPGAAGPTANAVVPVTPAGANTVATEAALTVPLGQPPGLYFVAVDLANKLGARTAVTAGGLARGRVHLAPVVVEAESAALEVPAAAELGAGLRVLTATVGFESGDTLAAALTWQALTELAGNYQVALRLTDAAGEEWARGGDLQPAAGAYPTSLWRPGEAVPDLYHLTLPGPGEPPGVYTLTVTVYDVSGLRTVGEAPLPVVLNRRHPRGERAAQYQLTPELGLERVEAPAQAAQGEAVGLAAHWLTFGLVPRDYQARWSLTDAAGTRHSVDLPLAPGAPPSAWPADAWLIGRVRLPLAADLTPGAYTLSVQLLDEAGRPAGAAVETGVITVTGRPRVFDVPALATEVGATFAGQLKLWGYDAERAGATLRLTLAWGALAAPRGNYKYFVHVFSPADEQIAAQADAVPRAFTYPTTQWAAGEVVTETVTLDLAAVPAGQYQVAVGWYDPAAPDLARLPAFDAQGQPLAQDRVVLPLSLQLPAPR